MAGDQSEKTEEPTPKRRREAREKGQVLKSKEVNTAAIILFAAYILNWTGLHIYQILYRFLHQVFQEIAFMHITVPVAQKLCLRTAVAMILCVLPLYFGAYLVALLVEGLQVGVLITFKPLNPQLERISPIKGFKRIFALKSLVELVKGLTKTFIIGWVVWSTVKESVPPILMSVEEPPIEAMILLGDIVVRIAKRVAGAMVVVASLDYLYQRYEFEKSLRMSKQEVKDEYKQTEGDPLIKGRQRAKMRQQARGAVSQAVPESSAVVTNPTHYAVALKYENGMQAPIVTAKGEGYFALLIKELAIKHDIPIFEDPPLAQALFKVVQVDAPIPSEFYMAVAQIIAKILKDKKKTAQHHQNVMKKAYVIPAAQPPPMIKH